MSVLRLYIKGKNSNDKRSRGLKEIWQSRCINKYYSGDTIPRIAITVPNYSVSFPERLIRFRGPRRFHVVCKWSMSRGREGTLKEKKILKPVILGKSSFVWLPEPYIHEFYIFYYYYYLFASVLAVYEVFRCSFMALAAYIPREKLFVLIKFYCPHKSFWPIRTIKTTTANPLVIITMRVYLDDMYVIYLHSYSPFERTPLFITTGSFPLRLSRPWFIFIICASRSNSIKARTECIRGVHSHAVYVI